MAGSASTRIKSGRERTGDWCHSSSWASRLIIGERVKIIAD
jgi:hypothetical protein